MQKSFLKWPGGKSGLLTNIVPYFINSDRSVFVEPFAGSAVISLNLVGRYDELVINDINQDLIDAFKVIRDVNDFSDFLRDVRYYFKNHNEDFYYKVRDEFNSESNKKGKTAKFIYLNRHCFNGLIRYNNDGNFNTPVGDYENPGLPSDRMVKFRQTVKDNNVKFLNNDFRDVISSYGEDTDIYCDPPYIPLNATSDFTSYQTGDFGIKEQRELKDLCLDHSGGVLVSNSGSELSFDLYSDFDVEELDVRRSIGSNVESRKKVGEILASRNLEKEDAIEDFFSFNGKGL